MLITNAWSAATPNVWHPKELVIAVGISLSLVAIGTVLGLSLGIGLHSDNKNLTLITTTSATTTSITTTTSSTTTTTLSTTTTTSSTTTTTSSSTTTTTITTITSTTSTTSTTVTSSTTTTITSTTSTTTTASIATGYQGSLSSSSAVYGGVNLTTLNYTYEAIQVMVDMSGTYALRSDSITNVKFFGYLYNSSFSPVSPLANLIAQADLNTGSAQFNLSSSLRTNNQYILVVTTANQSAIGTFNITATGPGNVVFLHRNPFSTTVFYGTTFNAGVDDSSNGRVSINADDVIQSVDGVSSEGYVRQVSFAFSVAPSTTTPGIWIYVLNRTALTLTFTPTITYQIPSTLITTGTTGVQTIVLPTFTLRVVSGQYIGVGFDANGGSLFAVSGRLQYYSNAIASFSAVPSSTYINATSGLAFRFGVFITTPVVG